MLIAPPEFLVHLFEPWNKFYSHSKLVETLVMFAHTGGLVIAGGLAISTDRATLRAASWSDAERRHHLVELAAIHRTVITALAITILSGLLLLTSDIETFWGSWIFWVKLGLIGVLLANGARMQSAEKKLHTDASANSPHWGGLRSAAIVSMALWLTVALAGIALLNYA